MKRLKTTALLWTVAATILCACHTSKVKNPDHLVAVDPQGALLDRNLKTGSGAQCLEPVFNGLQKSPVKHILIFIQGGLNSIDDGVVRANDLSNEILTDAHSPAYPIFISWNSSLFSSWREHLTSVSRGQTVHYDPVLWPLFNVCADLGRAVGRVPMTTLYASENVMVSSLFVLRPLKSDCGHTNLAKIYAQLNKQICELNDKGVTISFPEGSVSKTSMRLRYAEGIVTAYPQMFGALIVDTGGKEGWDLMLRRTKTMFLTTPEYDSGGVELFCEKLADFLKKHPNYDVTIVAHSMGSIVANEIIRRHGAELRLKNLVYMGAACGIEDFARDVVPFLETNNVPFYNLSLHPTNERAEDHLQLGYGTAEIAPHGSLLQWIDDYYSTAETDFGWTLGKFENVVPRMKAIPASVYPKMHLTAFAPGSLKGNGPQKHGDFSDIRYWDDRVWQGQWQKEFAVQKTK